MGNGWEVEVDGAMALLLADEEEEEDIIWAAAVDLEPVEVGAVQVEAGRVEATGDVGQEVEPAEAAPVEVTSIIQAQVVEV